MTSAARTFKRLRQRP